MISALEQVISAGSNMGWPVVILVLGLLCLAPIRRAVDRARTIQIKLDAVEIYLDPQRVNEGEEKTKEIGRRGVQEDAVG